MVQSPFSQFWANMFTSFAEQFWRDLLRFTDAAKDNACALPLHFSGFQVVAVLLSPWDFVERYVPVNFLIAGWEFRE